MTNVLTELLLPAIKGAVQSVFTVQPHPQTGQLEKTASSIRILAAVPAYIPAVAETIKTIQSGDRKAIIDTAVADFDILTGVDPTAIRLITDPKFPPALQEYVADRVGQIVQAILYAEGEIPFDTLPAAGAYQAPAAEAVQ